MGKKTFTLFLSMLLLVTVIATGCGQGGSGGSGSGGAVTIEFMHLWPEGISPEQYKLVNTIVDEYEQEKGNVKIEMVVLENEQYKNQMTVLSASNDLPDVGLTWAAGYLEPFVKGNLFAELDDVLDGELSGLFVPGTTEAYAIDGKTYALPIELNIAPIYYNKAIFSQFNLSPPQTYEEFKTIVSTLAAGGVAPIALGNKDKWTGSMWYMYLADRIGGTEPLKAALDRTGSFEVPMFLEAAKLAQELVDMNAFIKGFNGLTNDEGKTEFLNETAAMYLMGTWELPNYTTNPDVPEEFKNNVGFMKFPVIEGGDGHIDNWVGGPGVGLFVAENSPVKEEAKDFVQFFVKRWGELSVTSAGVIPATKVNTENIDLPPLYIELLNELNRANQLILFYDVQMKPASAETHKNLIQALFGKAVTPEEFVKQQEDALKEEYGM